MKSTNGQFKLTFTGMTNKVNPYNMPKDKLFNAVNVQFDNFNNVVLPRAGKTKIYSGSGIHSIFKSSVITLFVENGALKKLNSNNTATSLVSGLGLSRVYYCMVGDVVYWSNQDVSGKIVNGVASSWGTQRPPRQPDCTATPLGGLAAGEYRVALTWISDEESGTGMGKRVTVAEGGGIHLTNFPTPPAYVTAIAVYVSSVNGKDMYLHGEYPANTSDLTLGYQLDTIPLQTQFGFVPAPQGLVVAHYGKIYYPRGDRLYWTAIRRYGLQFANSYFRLDSTIKTVVAVPNALYVGTEKAIYRIFNIDIPVEQGVATVELLHPFGTTPGSECYAKEGNLAYFMSDRGFIEASVEGLKLLTFDQVAMPTFKMGSMGITEQNGLRYLTGIFQEGTQSTFANSEYNSSEVTRGSL